jgi:hypothetical protein
VLQTVQVPTDPGDVGVVHTSRRLLEVRLEHGLEALLEFNAYRVVEALEFSLCVLDAACEVGIFGEPAVAEPDFAFEFGDAVLGSGDVAIDVLERWLGVGGPVVRGPGLGSCP